MEHVVNHFGEAVGHAEEFLAQSRKRLADLRGQADQPFEYGHRLEALALRQQQLMGALDLTRNHDKAVAQEGVDDSNAIRSLRDIRASVKNRDTA